MPAVCIHQSTGAQRIFQLPACKLLSAHQSQPLVSPPSLPTPLVSPPSLPTPLVGPPFLPTPLVSPPFFPEPRVGPPFLPEPRVGPPFLPEPRPPISSPSLPSCAFSHSSLSLTLATNPFPLPFATHPLPLPLATHPFPAPLARKLAIHHTGGSFANSNSFTGALPPFFGTKIVEAPQKSSPPYLPPPPAPPVTACTAPMAVSPTTTPSQALCRPSLAA
ncbi:unnamed protein product [Closterium sp. NIES-53]